MGREALPAHIAGRLHMPRYERAGFLFIGTAERLAFRRTEQYLRRYNVILTVASVWVAIADVVLAASRVWTGAVMGTLMLAAILLALRQSLAHGRDTFTLDRTRDSFDVGGRPLCAMSHIGVIQLVRSSDSRGVGVRL